MKAFLVSICALSLVACVASHETPCLLKGEAAKILKIKRTPPTERSDGYATLLLTTDNKTVRVCRTRQEKVEILNEGQIVRGYTDDPQYDWPFPNWYRIG